MNKKNFWIKVSNETIPKPKIRERIKWFLKQSHSVVPSPKEGFSFRKMGKEVTNLGGHVLILTIIVTDIVFAF